MKHFAIIAALAAAACGFTACSDDEGGKSTPPLRISLSATEQAVAESANELAYRTFYELYSTNDKDMVFSPMSTQMALAMLSNGASSETLDEMAGLLCSGGSVDDVNSYYGKLYKNLPITDARSTVMIANSAWRDINMTFKDCFTQSIADTYGAPSLTYDAGNPTKAAAEMNKWISQATKGKIENMLSEDDINDFAIVNALYFKSEWKKKFDKDKTKQGKFTNLDKTTCTAKFMQDEIKAGFDYIDGTYVADVPFGNDAYRMVFIRTADDETPAQAIAKVQAAGPHYLDNLKESKIFAYIPRFTARTHVGMTKIFKQLGFEKTLSDYADFSNLSDKHVAIKSILHECCIEVDEEGATAAAATVANGDLMANPLVYEIRLDRPFAYMIRETSTGAILFMGAVNKM